MERIGRFRGPVVGNDTENTFVAVDAEPVVWACTNPVPIRRAAERSLKPVIM